jgi:AcrR family transcriptional regulator
MRALPGKDARSTVVAAPVTRGTVVEAQRRRILRAAAELIAKRGYGDISVELIVKRGRVSFKTFYAHFPNKEACFLEFFDEAFAAYEATLAEALADAADRPWAERVLAILAAFLADVAADPIIARACLVEAPTAGPEVLARYEQAVRAFAPIFAEGRELTPVGARLPATLEETLAGSILWSVYQRLIVGEVGEIERLLPAAGELVLRPYLGEADAKRLAGGFSALAPAR